MNTLLVGLTAALITLVGRILLLWLGWNLAAPPFGLPEADLLQAFGVAVLAGAFTFSINFTPRD